MTVLLRGCWSARAELEVALGDAGRALDILDRLLAGTANLTEYGPHAGPYLAWLCARALTALARTGEAAAELEGTLTVAEKQGQTAKLWRLHADLAKAYLALRRREEARRELSTARTIIQQVASNIPDDALRENFLKQALTALPTAPAPSLRRAAKDQFGGLTERERQVAQLIAQGKSNPAIAEELTLSRRTVDRYVSSILSKLNFHSRSQIAGWVTERGFPKLKSRAELNGRPDA